MALKEVFMKHRVAILSGAAVLAIIGVAGCHSQQKSNAPAAQQSAAVPPTPPVPPGQAPTSRDNRSCLWSDCIHHQRSQWLEVCRNHLAPRADAMPPAYPAAGLSYAVLSPDRVSAYIVLPGVSWTGSSNGYNFQGQKCPSNINIDSAAGFLLNIAVPILHPYATIGNSRAA